MHSFIYKGLFKSQKAVKITPCYNDFASCSGVCTYEHILFEG